MLSQSAATRLTNRQRSNQRHASLLLAMFAACPSDNGILCKHAGSTCMRSKARGQT